MSMHENAVLVIVIGNMILPFVLYFVYKAERGRADLLQKCASKRGGQVNRVMVFGLSKWEFSKDGVDYAVSIYPGSKNSPPRTYVTAQIVSYKDFVFNVRPENILDKAFKALGMQDFTMHNERFDSGYVVSSNNENLIRNFLDQDIQEAILNLKFGRSSVSYKKSIFNLEVMRLAREESEIREVVDLAEKLANKLKPMIV
jgi:hypothetical protein